MDNILDHVVVQGQRYDIVSPTAFGDYIETIGSACINPDGYAKGSTFLARLGNEQFYYEATAAITQGSAILEGTNCKKTTVTGREAELALEIENLGETVDSLNEAFTNEVNTRSELGAHNCLLFSMTDIIRENNNGSWSGNNFVSKGVTYTCNADGSIKVNSSGASANGFFAYSRFLLASDYEGYILNGSPSGATSSDWGLYIRYYDNSKTLKSEVIFNGNEEISIISDSDHYYFDVCIIVFSGKAPSNVMFYPMLRLATDADTSYQPYAATNQQLTKDDSGLTANAYLNGAVNLLPLREYAFADTDITITTTPNGIVINGTTTKIYNISLIADNDSVRLFTDGILETGKRYKFCGCPKTASVDSYYIYMNFVNNGSVTQIVDIGDGNIIDVPSTATGGNIVILIASGITLNNVLFKPMITVADMPNSDYAHYVPYAMTNRELTENLTVQKTTATSDRVNIIGYDSTNNQYTCPCDGYVYVYAGAGTGFINVFLQTGGVARTVQETNHVVYDAIFVKKGTVVYVNTTQSTASEKSVLFAPLY